MIYTEDQAIKLGGLVLPGLIKSIEVTETAKIDEQVVEGSATKPKQATGYEDAKVTIELIIDDTETQTKYERLAALRALFRAAGQAVPQALVLVCENTSLHGVDQVLFKDLKHKEESKRNQLAVTVELLQYVPQVIQVQKSVSSGTGGGGGAKSKRQSAGRSKPKSQPQQVAEQKKPSIKDMLPTPQEMLQIGFRPAKGG